MIWFALAAAAILPIALDGLFTRADVAAPKVNRMISLAALAGLAVALAVTLARPASWFVVGVARGAVSRPSGRRRATPPSRLFATDGTADWLLWRIPDLRGRIAFDVRFELYDEETLDRIARYGGRQGDWRAFTTGYDVVVVEAPRTHPRVRVLLADPGSDVVFDDAEFSLVSR